MTKRKFAVGDNVQLASGGPRMTIVRIAKGQAECCWFDKDHKEHRSKFPPKALVTTPAREMSDEELDRNVQQILNVRCPKASH